MNKITQIEKDSIKPNLLFTERNNLSVYAEISKGIYPTIYEKIKGISEFEFGIKDAFDEYDNKYKYLICIDEDNNEIVGFYRYILCGCAYNNDCFNLSTGKFYRYSETFKKDLWMTMELGRSVVNSKAQKKTYSLQTLWKGLSSLKDYFIKKGNLINYYQKEGVIKEECILDETLTEKSAIKINGEYINLEDFTLKYVFGEVSLQKRLYPGEDGKAAIVSILTCFSSLFCYNKGNDSINAKDYLFIPRTPVLQDEIKEEEKKNKFSTIYALKKMLKDNKQHVPSLFFYYTGIAKEEGIVTGLPVDNELLESWEMAIRVNLQKLETGNTLDRLLPKYNDGPFK